jgi:DNA repair protein RadC
METTLSMDVRERMAAGAELTDAELVALLLATGIRGADALTLGRRLLAHLGGMEGLRRSTMTDLTRLPGVGQAKATRLLAACELGRRLAATPLDLGAVIRSSHQIAAAYGPRLAHLDREYFYVILLDSKHRKIKEVCVSVGCLDSAIVHPREVFKPAVAESAAAVILVHNHPSGDPTPSAEDKAVTRRLVATAQLLGVDLLDHVIVARQGSLSLRDRGEM